MIRINLPRRSIVAEEVPAELASVLEKLTSVKQRLGRVILGQDAVLEQMLITLLCNGHALLEGVPGTAKTLAVRVLALTLNCQSKRIQFTPDLMPSDIVGTNVFNLSTNQFSFHAGPVFTDLLLADEINRAPAKTQSALLEAMAERQATVDGVRRVLSPVFTVFATQNPVEFEGTYPLPEAQQDRFLIKIQVGYPSFDAERAVLEAVDRGQALDRLDASAIPPAMSVADLEACRAALAQVRVEPGVMDYVLKLVRATREHDSVMLGAGPRGSIFLLSAAKAHAILRGRVFVTPDDVVAMLAPVLGHRISLTAEAEVSGLTRGDVLQGILDKIEVPR